MRWQGGKQSENLEDRRRIGPVGEGIAAGGGLESGDLSRLKEIFEIPYERL
jgi:hypothetical protein